MHTMFRTIAALMFFVAVPVLAMPTGDPSDTSETMRDGLKHDVTDYEADAAFNTADREMSRVYAAVLKKYGKDIVFIGKFRAAQRAWLVFRDAEVAATYPDPDTMSAYGSIYPICVSQLKTKLTQQRTEELKRWRDGAREGDVCSGSVRVNGDGN